MAFKLLAILTIVALAHGNQFEHSRQIQKQQHQINMEMQMEKERFQREMDEQNNKEFMEMMFQNNMQQHLRDHQGDRDDQEQMVDQYNINNQINKDDERQQQFHPQQSDNSNVLPTIFLAVPHNQLFTLPITVSQSHMVKQEQVPNFNTLQQDKDNEHFPSKYEFGYFVNDLTTGDIKSQHEHREGDQVHGSYSLVEPDGSIRTVDYTADDVNGFQSEVRRTQNIHPVPLSTAQREISYNPVMLSTSHPVLVENFMTPVSRVVVTRREGPGTFTHRSTTTNHQ